MGNLLKECEKRMKAVPLTSDQKENYRKICKQVEEAQKRSSAQRNSFANELKFLVFYDGSKVLKTENHYWKALLRGNALSRYILPVQKDQNLLNIHRVDGGHPILRGLKKLCMFTVYQEPEKVDQNPVLTLDQVAQQIPKQLMKRAKAFALFLKEDNYTMDSYNFFTGLYEFEVVVFE